MLSYHFVLPCKSRMKHVLMEENGNEVQKEQDEWQEMSDKLQLMDYAIDNHADGNWLSNFEEPSPTGPLRIRDF